MMSSKRCQGCAISISEHGGVSLVLPLLTKPVAAGAANWAASSTSRPDGLLRQDRAGSVCQSLDGAWYHIAPHETL
jgi:hypothetical protein